MNEPSPSDPYRFMLQAPRLGQRVFVSGRAVVTGAVVLGDDVSVWPMAVIRGDVNEIHIGRRSNVQDTAVLHVTHEGPFSPEGAALRLGEDVTIGHGAILHACTVGDRVLIGMGAIVLDGAVIEDDAMVAAGAVVTPGAVVATGTLWRGNPARQVRPLEPGEIQMLAYSAGNYVRLKDRYLQQGEHILSQPVGESR